MFTNPQLKLLHTLQSFNNTEFDQFLCKIMKVVLYFASIKSHTSQYLGNLPQRMLIRTISHFEIPSGGRSWTL